MKVLSLPLSSPPFPSSPEEGVGDFVVKSVEIPLEKTYNIKWGYRLKCPDKPSSFVEDRDGA